jgi:hypothetical protein
VDVNDSFSQHWVEDEHLKYLVDDITTIELPAERSLVTSLFTFQFISEKHRMPLMKKIYDHQVEGGAFVFSEKVLSPSGKIQNMMKGIRENLSNSPGSYYEEREIGTGGCSVLSFPP